MDSFQAAIDELRNEFSTPKNAYNRMLFESNVKWRALFIQVAITSVLLQQMVIQVRGLDGSMGVLYMLFSHMVLANLVCNWILVAIGYILGRRECDGTRRECDGTRIECDGTRIECDGTQKTAFFLLRGKNILGAFVIIITAASTSLGILAKALAKECGASYTAADLQFCYISTKFCYDSFIFLMVYQYFFNETIPMPISFTLIGVVISFLFIVATIAVSFESRLLVHEAVIILIYLTFFYLMVDRHVNKRHSYMRALAEGADHSVTDSNLAAINEQRGKSKAKVSSNPPPRRPSHHTLEDYCDANAGRLNFGFASGSFEIEIGTGGTPSIVSEITDDFAHEFEKASVVSDGTGARDDTL